MTAAIVPVAFYDRSHIAMTERFLMNLCDEVPVVSVWHNGGPLADEGWEALERTGVEVYNAAGWRFYEMWNAGIERYEDEDAVLVLNNDIDWPEGSLSILAERLRLAPPDVAVVSPDPDSWSAKPLPLVEVEPTPAYRGLLGWCFAVRPRHWQPIDERYHIWYGDDELGILLKQARLRTMRAPGVHVRHSKPMTTAQFRPDFTEKRMEDERLFREKWS